MKLPKSLTPAALLEQVAISAATTLIGVGMDHLRARTGPKERVRRAQEQRVPRLGVCIYGLADPRTNEVRYVGASVDPWRRRSEHLADARSGGMSAKCVWLNALLTEGLEPQLLLLARTTRSNWRVVEEKHMARYTNLTNRGAEAPEPDLDDAEDSG